MQELEQLEGGGAVHGSERLPWLLRSAQSLSGGKVSLCSCRLVCGYLYRQRLCVVLGWEPSDCAALSHSFWQVLSVREPFSYGAGR